MSSPWSTEHCWETPIVGEGERVVDKGCSESFGFFKKKKQEYYVDVLCFGFNPRCEI